MTRLYPAEYVLPGHPDKLCDAIADRLIQDASAREQRALAQVEVAVHRNNVTVTGRIACQGSDTIDIPAAARDIYRSAGYSCAKDADSPAWYPGPGELIVHNDVCLERLLDGESEFRALSDDQCIVTGYATNLPGTSYLPPEHWLVGNIGRRLEALRSERPDLLLGPDGKVIAVLEQAGERYRLAQISTSLQQSQVGDSIDLQRALREVLCEACHDAASAIPGFDPALPAEINVNGAADFSVGGPEADNGLSGKKLVVDAYGPRVPIGGGALSGKDFYKADRAGAILARRLAKLVVLTGAAEECTVTLALFPGDREARLFSLRTSSGAELDTRRWANLIDLRIESVGDRWTNSADLVDVARHSHFLPGRPWEAMTLA